MQYIAIILLIIVGIYLFASGINLFIKDRKNDKRWWQYLDVILDIILDPITGVGIRLLFGGLFILAGLMMLFFDIF